jgi:flagellar motility protein MotE (MotC chaperone)
MKLLPARLVLPAPRLLPITIAAMAVMLGVKSAALMRDALAAGADRPAAAAQAEKPALAAKPAVAPAGAAPAPAAPVAAAPAPAPAAAAVPAPPPAPVPATEPPIAESERTLLLELRKRRVELDARESTIAAREAVLAGAEARLQARLDDLAGLQKRLESLDATRREHDEANWRSLVKLYETMKPREAGAIFNDLDLPVLLPILDRMKEAKAAAILAAMQPDRARLATTELAQARAHANAVPPPAKPSGGG